MSKKAEKPRIDKRFENWQRPQYYVSIDRVVMSERGKKELEKIKKLVGLN